MVIVTYLFKDVRAEISQSIDFFYFLLQSDNEYLCQKCKKIGVTDFISELKCVEKYPEFEKLKQIIFTWSTVV